MAAYAWTTEEPALCIRRERRRIHHAFRVADGKSASHCDSIRSRLNRFATKLPPGVMLDELTAGQLEHAVVNLGLGPKTRNEYKITLGNWYAWAAKQNPPLVPKGFNPGKEMEVLTTSLPLKAEGLGLRAIARELRMPPSSVHKALSVAA